MDNNILNGFEVFEDLLPGANAKNKTFNGQIDDDNKIDINSAAEELTEDEINKIRSKTPTANTEGEEDDNEGEDVVQKRVPKDKTGSKKPVGQSKGTGKENNRQVSNDEDDTDDTVDDVLADDIHGSSAESDIIVSFFDSLSEKLGWDDVEDDEKPKTAEDLIQYFRDVIEENSKPEYASDEVEALDKFVKSGGDLRRYFSIDGDLDLENINMEDETNQRLVLKEFLKEKGFDAKQIDKKLGKYEDAGLLEDEAEDALEALKDIKTKRKQQLLAEQEKAARAAENRQREFFNNVVEEIKGMDNIYGIDVPEKDKRALLEYIFKPGADGMTKYQKDYAKSLKNLITSAYFTMKGDTLIDIAKKKGKKDALDNFKDSLTRNSGIDKRSKRQIINTDDETSIWNAFTRRLRVA